MAERQKGKNQKGAVKIAKTVSRTYNKSILGCMVMQYVANGMVDWNLLTVQWFLMEISYKHI